MHLLIGLLIFSALLTFWPGPTMRVLLTVATIVVFVGLAIHVAKGPQPEKAMPVIYHTASDPPSALTEDEQYNASILRQIAHCEPRVEPGREQFCRYLKDNLSDDERSRPRAPHHPAPARVGSTFAQHYP